MRRRSFLKGAVAALAFAALPTLSMGLSPAMEAKRKKLRPLRDGEVEVLLDVKNKLLIVDGPEGSTLTIREFFDLLREEYSKSELMSERFPVERNASHIYTLDHGWILNWDSFSHLREGSISQSHHTSQATFTHRSLGNTKSGRWGPRPSAKTFTAGVQPELRMR